MNKSQIEAIRTAVESVFAELSSSEIKDLVMSSYAELRQEMLVPVAA